MYTKIGFLKKGGPNYVENHVDAAIVMNTTSEWIKLLLHCKKKI